MATFIWQSADGDWNNPESWGQGQIVNASAAATTASSATVDLSADTPDLSSVSAGDVIRLVGRTDGLGSGEHFLISAVDDGLDTVTVSPTPSSSDTGITWIIFQDLPAATDDVNFPGTSMQSVITGLDQSAINRFNRIRIQSDFDGDIGTAANPLILSTTELWHEGNKVLHYKDGGNKTDLLIMRTSGLNVNTLEGNTGGAEVTEIRILGGLVIGRNLDCTTLIIGRSSEVASVTDVSFEESVGALTDLFMNDGNFLMSSTVNRAQIAGGQLTVGVVGSTAATITTLYQMSGHVIYNSNTTLATAHVLGGLLDYSQDLRPKNIELLRLFPNAFADLPPFVTFGGGAISEPPVRGG